MSSRLTPATRAPSSSTRRSPNTTKRAFARTSSSAKSFAVSSGLTPAGSPMARAITGLGSRGVGMTDSNVHLAPLAGRGSRSLDERGGLGAPAAGELESHGHDDEADGED